MTTDRTQKGKVGGVEKKERPFRLMIRTMWMKRSERRVRNSVTVIKSGFPFLRPNHLTLHTKVKSG